MLAVNQLAGFGARGGAAAALATLTQVLSATGTAATIVAPGGILAGDLLVFFEQCASGSAPAAAVPSGFSQIATATILTARVVMSRKLATGSEGGANLQGMTGALYKKAMLVFRGNAPIAAVTIGSVGQEATAGDPAAQVVAASGGTPPLVVIGGYSNGATIDPRAFNPAKDGEINPDANLYLAWKIYDLSPADVTVDMDDEGNQNLLCSCYIACS